MISFPYTSVKTIGEDGAPKYDRAVDSNIKRLYNKLRYKKGVAIDSGNAFQVVADTGMNVKVKCNGAWAHVGGDFCYESAETRVLSVQAPDTLYDRIDRVVIRNDITHAVRACDLYIVTGIPASSPVAPALTNTTDVQEIGIATLFIAKNVNNISQDRISDTRLDESVCGVLSNAFGDVDTSQFFFQIEALIKQFKEIFNSQLNGYDQDFDTWFETIKGKLGDDPATALQSQVDDLQAAVGGLPLQLSAGTNSIQIVADESRLESVNVAGFTTQTGSGDPSPENIRPIKNAGQYNAISMLDGSVYIYSVTTSGFTKTVKVDVDQAVPNAVFDGYGAPIPAISSWLKPGAANNDDTDYPHFRTGSVTESSGSLVLYIPVNVLSETTVEGIKTYLSQNPLTVAYKSTENTGEYYTGLAVQQNGAYRCEIIRLADRLHAGDTLETNVRSEYDTEIVITGKELWSERTPGSFVYSAPIVKETVDFEEASNNYIDGGEVYSTMPDKSLILFSGAVAIKDSRYSTVEAFTAMLKERYSAGNPVRVFCKSVSGGAGRLVRRETHTRKTLVLDGDAAKFTKAGSYWNLPNQSAPNVAAVPKCVCSSFPGSVFQANQTYNFLFAAQAQLTPYFDDLDACNAFLAQQYAAGTPVTVEYDLAAPEVYVDEPVQLENPQGASTVSSEESTTLTVYIRSTKELQPLTVSLNGANQGQYNGETKQDINLVVTPQSIGALPKVKYAEYKFPDQQVPAQGGTLFEATQAAMGIPDTGQVVSILVENTGWTGIVPQHWSPNIGAKKVYVLLYNTTQTARTVGPTILVFYYEE